MSRFLKLEFWLFAIAGLIVVATFIAVAHRLPLAGQVFLFLSVTWMVLAIVWMFREIVRKVRG